MCKHFVARLAVGLETAEKFGIIDVLAAMKCYKIWQIMQKRMFDWRRKGGDIYNSRIGEYDRREHGRL